MKTRIGSLTFVLSTLVATHVGAQDRANVHTWSTILPIGDRVPTKVSLFQNEDGPDLLTIERYCLAAHVTLRRVMTGGYKIELIHDGELGETAKMTQYVLGLSGSSIELTPIVWRPNTFRLVDPNAKANEKSEQVEDGDAGDAPE